MGSRFIVSFPVFLCFYLFFPLMGACYGTNKRLYVRLSRTCSRKT